MQYGEIIIGPPGSGKTTYVKFKKDLLSQRNPFLINLDPGNESDYKYDYDIRSISTTQDTMKTREIGPNLSVKRILYEFVSKQVFDDIRSHNENRYFIFDFPGQCEFFLSDSILREFVYSTRKLISFTVVNLIDSVFFIDYHSRLSSYLISTMCCVLLQCPFVGVISKCDNLKNLPSKVPIRDIVYGITPDMGKGFYHAIEELVANEGLLSFELLDYDNKETVLYLQYVIDKANGFFYLAEENVCISKEDLLDYYSCE
ncbi:GPN-loop GTPase 2 [Astathelohania contejeani]|uniref:GPN-loop GTPase 2 n=1 Tax=Astathelohania contejeani TaxID=164912 RepID=A0ABQ7HYY0_9MICR|nr:GPN-loop GTPase 2 [Thelohania contejeani]